ncbi:hypothetical protein IL54_3079 [Sphingobium sp. ba1]|jgi:hypothetical protein|uniref:hypothetical protein n=1 Tax=Sphingobium sp. ba1 TaxID=1522072 RepID=UPI00050692F5|nr:hypothetical protein [Sphingobium sp. ba1]KFL47652.1 hypothetical protein IL54_3079 [Sphingobium sp. ba1]
MASSPIIENSISSGDIAVIVAQTPALVLVDSAKRDDLFAHIKREISAFEPDVSTAKGRDAIKSFAFKITRTKTAIDDAGKKLNEEARSKIAVVDAARRDARETLDELAKSVRKPLTEWEEAEKARVAQCESIIEDLRDLAHVSLIDDSISVRERGTKVWAIELDPMVFGDRLEVAQAAKDAAMATLKEALARLLREEADRAELQRLRDEAAARAEVDKIAAEKAESERLEAARIEDERLATERAAQEAAERAQREQERQIAAQKAEAERIERAKVEAAEQAAREAQEAAKAEQDARDREHARQLAEAQAERDRIAAQEKARIAEEQAAAAAQAKRDADKAHRTSVMRAAKEAIMTCGADEETAKKIVLLIRAGDVPNVSLVF